MDIKIVDSYITLGQCLKKAGVIQSGGEVKILLANKDIKVNDELENRRGKKLYKGDVIQLDNMIMKIV